MRTENGVDGAVGEVQNDVACKRMQGNCAACGHCVGAAKDGVVPGVLKSLQEAVSDGDAADASVLVDELRATDQGQLYPTVWLEATAAALRSGRWDDLSEAFSTRKFIGDSGHVLVVGQYRQRRDGVANTVLSMLCGNVIRRVDLGRVAEASRKLFGTVQENPPEAIPLNVTFAAGAVGGQAGEAFVVPDGWTWKSASFGPAFNDMNEQRKRYDVAVACVERIFTPETAALLVRLVGGVSGMVEVAADEYGLHDAAGHGNGISLSVKLDRELLPNAAYRGFEEFRADGVALELAGMLFGFVYASKIVASNLIVRLGLDAHRGGGMDADTDVQCALLGLHHLFESKQVEMSPSGKLTLVDPTPEGLWRATKPQRDLAVEVTQCELRLRRHEGLGWLYAKYFDVPECIRQVFEEKVVVPCAGLHELR